MYHINIITLLVRSFCNIIIMIINDTSVNISFASSFRFIYTSMKSLFDF